MTHRSALFGSTAALFALAGVAQADVTADQVWENMKAVYAASGYALETGTVVEAGGTVTVSDLVVAMPNPYAELQEEFEFDISAKLPSLVFAESGDGTVNVIAPDTYVVALEITEGGETGSINVAVDQAGTTIVASGSAEEVTYTIASPAVQVTLDSIDFPDEEIPADAFGFTMALNDLNATYVVGSGAPLPLNLQLTAGSLTGDVSVDVPDEEVVMNADIDIADVSWTSQSQLAQGDVPGDMTAMLKAGMSSDTKMQHGGSTYDISVDDGSDSFAMTGSAQSGSAEVLFGDASIGYLVGNTGMQMAMSGSQIPLPEVTFSTDAASYGLQMPVIATEEAKDVELTVALEGLQINDMIWGLVDPTGQLPRDAANLIVRLAGKANWFHDIMDPNAAEAMMGGGLPGALEALNIEEFEVSAAGASLTGTGAFTFNMDDLETFQGLPAPTGAVDLQLSGANGLIDKLIAMGMLPEDQAMGARMMMGLFARPGDGPDNLVSKIEVDGATGSVSANGQRLR